MSTPFDNEAVDMLDRLGVSAFKVASCDITNFPLLKKIAQKKKPMFVSTGASNINEIKKALNYISRFNKKICLMQCTLSYPTKPEDANLLALNEFKKNFKNVLLGLSDHTLGYKIAASSVLLGVRAIEKHYTYDKGLKKSADHWLSINSQELKKLREDVDLLVSASGDGKKRVLKCEHLTRKLARRSLVTTRFIQKGDSVLIHINKNKSLIFSSKDQQLSVEKSIFLGKNKILNNLCITISGNLINKNKFINWKIIKSVS